MVLELIYENSFAKAEYEREKSVLHCTFNGIVNADLGIEMFQVVLDKLSDYPIKAGVYNCTKMKGTFTHVNDWLKEEFYPPMIEQGYCCWSMSTSDVFTRFAANMLISRLTPKGVSAKVFDSTDKAKSWAYKHIG
jgi:hypothetical protein